MVALEKTKRLLAIKELLQMERTVLGLQTSVFCGTDKEACPQPQTVQYPLSLICPLSLSQ